MSKIVLLLSLALLYCVVIADKKSEDAEHEELIEICNAINDPSKPKEIKSRGKECNDLVHNVVSGKATKEDNIKIWFLAGADALSTFSFHSTAAMNSFKNRLTEEQYAIMLNIHGLSRESVLKFNSALAGYRTAIEKPGNSDRFKEVDALLTRASECVTEIEKQMDEKFDKAAQVPELHEAMQSGVEFLGAVSRIQGGISEL